MKHSVLLLGLTALLAACTNAQPTQPTYTCPTGATVTPISAVQGNGAASPLVGQIVTVRGVVTLDAQAGLSGFYLQDIAPDADARTSEGLFVFTAAAPQAVKVGEVVQLSGTVKEFGGLTELDTVTSLTSCGLTRLPGAATLTYPLPSLDALEAVEGMRVTVTTPMTVTDTFTLGRFGELGLSSGGRLFNPTNGQGGSVEGNRLRTLRLDDLSSRQNPATVPYLTSSDAATATRRVGDTVAGLVGVMHFANGNYKLQPTRAPVFQNTNPRPAAPDEVGGTLRVAAVNVLNYFTTLGSAGRGASSAAEFERQKAKIVAELRGLSADVITLMEVENNGEAALDNLVEALNTAAGKTEFASVRTGTVGTDAIRVAIIYRPDRVDAIGAAQIDPAAVYSRPPVAQTFQEKNGGGVFTVVANHFKSKGS
jgi:predicted extracellular nuclease